MILIRSLVQGRPLLTWAREFSSSPSSSSVTHDSAPATAQSTALGSDRVDCVGSKQSGRSYGCFTTAVHPSDCSAGTETIYDHSYTTTNFSLN